jgi:F-type H+-transporting ATPase subunit epsilon
MATMHCLVATPTRELFSGEVHYASVPSVEGDYGVLPGHEMIVSMNRAGGLCTLHLDEAGT